MDKPKYPSEDTVNHIINDYWGGGLIKGRKPKDRVMQDGFGRSIDEDIYWRNTDLSQASIARIKEYHRTHPVQADGTRPKSSEDGQS